MLEQHTVPESHVLAGKEISQRVKSDQNTEMFLAQFADLSFEPRQEFRVGVIDTLGERHVVAITV